MPRFMPQTVNRSVPRYDLMAVLVRCVVDVRVMLHWSFGLVDPSVRKRVLVRAGFEVFEYMHAPAHAYLNRKSQITYKLHFFLNHLVRVSL